MAARLIATITISAMNRTTPRWRPEHRVCWPSYFLVPYFVAQRDHRLVDAVAPAVFLPDDGEDVNVTG